MSGMLTKAVRCRSCLTVSCPVSSARTLAGANSASSQASARMLCNWLVRSLDRATFPNCGKLLPRKRKAMSTTPLWKHTGGTQGNDLESNNDIVRENPQPTLLSPPDTECGSETRWEWVATCDLRYSPINQETGYTPYMGRPCVLQLIAQFAAIFSCISTVVCIQQHSQ